MHVLLTGATGYIGSVVAEALIAAGHSVTGVARSDAAAGQISLKGVTPLRGDLTSPSSLAEGAKQADGVIHTGTTNDGRLDAEAVGALLDAVRGTGKPFIYTSGIWVLGNTGDTPADETAPLKPIAMVAWRPAVETTVLDAAKTNVRAIVIRPAIVYGRGGGIPAELVKSARETDAARFAGDGHNRWPMVHVHDLADLYVRAFEQAAPGTLLHAADDTSFSLLEIAEAASAAARTGGRTISWPLEEARKILGPYADALVLDQRVSALKARTSLGWNPREHSIIEDLRHGSYLL
jgi:nucleoside-diphosphate-sugar epimerase